MKSDEAYRNWAGLLVGIALIMNLVVMIFIFVNPSVSGLVSLWVVPLLLVAIVIAILSFKPEKSVVEETGDDENAVETPDKGGLNVVECPKCKALNDVPSGELPAELACVKCGARLTDISKPASPKLPNPERDTVTSVQCPECRYWLSVTGTTRPVEAKCGNCGKTVRVDK